MTRSRCNDWQMFEEWEDRQERYRQEREAIERFVPLGGTLSEDQAREAGQTETSDHLRGQRDWKVELGGILAQPFGIKH